jgi:hypothetical protein
MAAGNVSFDKAYNITRKAFGDKVSLLDANRASGSAGIYDCLKAGQGVSTSSPEINKGDFYGGKASTTLERARDIQSKLIKCSALDSRDKKGLAAAHNAIVYGYCEKLSADQYKVDYAIFNQKKMSAKASSTLAISLCDKTYRKCIRPAVPLSSFAKMVNMEGCQILKDKCVAGAYSVYSDTLMSIWTAFGDPTNPNMVINKMIKCNQVNGVKEDYTAL